MRMEQLTIIKYSTTYKLAVCMSWRERERGRGQRKEGRKEIRKKGRHRKGREVQRREKGIESR